MYLKCISFLIINEMLNNIRERRIYYSYIKQSSKLQLFLHAMSKNKYIVSFVIEYYEKIKRGVIFL